MNLTNKVALVTGGGQGIGKAIAVSLLQAGAKVVLANRNVAVGEATAKELSEQFETEVLFVRTDVADFTHVQKAVEITVETFGTLDIMINNAGIGVATPLLDTDMEVDFKPVIDVNINGTANGIVVAGRKMRDLGVKGVILNVSSVFGDIAKEELFAYQASKAAIIMMTKSSALELSQHGIRVVGIQPGAVETDIMRRLAEAQPGIKEAIKRTHLRGNYVTLEQIADTVSFLVSDLAGGINGISIPIDDGFTTFKAKMQ